MEASAKDTPITKSKRKRLRKSMKNNACGPVDVLTNHAADLSTQDKKEEFEPEFVIKTKGFLRNEKRDCGLDEPLPQDRPRSFFESVFCGSSSDDDDDDDDDYNYFGDSDESSDEDENWFKWYKNNSFRRQNSARRSGEQYKAEDVDGYVGDQDLDSVLNYIEGTPAKKGRNNSQSGISVGGSAKKKNHNSAKKKGSTEQNGGSAKKKDCKNEHQGAASEANPKKPNQKSHARRQCEKMV